MNSSLLVFGQILMNMSLYLYASWSFYHKGMHHGAFLRGHFSGGA